MADSIYKNPEGEAEILALYGEALAALGSEHGSHLVGTRYGKTHVLAVGDEDAPPVMFLPGGNFLNPTCLRWFSRLSERYRVYAPDLIGQPGKSAQIRPSPKGDGHALWVGDVLDGLGLQSVPLVGLSYGAGVAIRSWATSPSASRGRRSSRPPAWPRAGSHACSPGWRCRCSPTGRDPRGCGSYARRGPY